MSASSIAFAGFPRPHGLAAHRTDPLSLAEEPITGAASPPRTHALHWVPAFVALALFVAALAGLLPPIPW